MMKKMVFDISKCKIEGDDGYIANDINNGENHNDNCNNGIHYYSDDDIANKWLFSTF